MGPEDSEKKMAKVYMMVDGQPVEISPNIAEITYSEDKQSSDILDFGECEITMKVEAWKRTLELAGVDTDAIWKCSREIVEAMVKAYVEFEKAMVKAYVEFEKAMEQIANSVRAGLIDMESELEEFEDLERELKMLDRPTAWDRKKVRERRRTAEREAASRFRQYKASEKAWSAQKRTGPRRREWRGPWKEN